MYSVVLMMALTGSGDAVAHCGASSWSCNSTVVASCTAKHGKVKLFGCSCGHSLFGGHGSHSCSTATTCSNGSTCGHSHSLFRGHSCSNSCNGSGHGHCGGGFGLFRRHHNSCSAPVVVCSGN